MKEMDIIRKKAGAEVASQISDLLRVMDTLPINACALAIHPAICVDKRFKKEALSKRVFILVHEYVHLKYQHASTAMWLMSHPKCEFLKPRETDAVALFVVEEWANSKTKQLLGYAPKRLLVQPLNGELRGMTSMRKWLVQRAVAIGSDPAQLKHAVKRIRHSYGKR
jgi:hypothetical protein